MKKLKVGIIGQGRSGRDIHGAFFRTEAGRERFEVAAVAELIGQRRARAAEEYGCDVYEDYRDLLARDDQDMHRETDPLRVADGAIVVDSTELTEEETVERILSAVEACYGGAKTA